MEHQQLMKMLKLVTQPAVAVGQVWRDLDKRMPNRKVEVVRLEGSEAVILSKTYNDSPSSLKQTRASLKRFNGKGQGYGFLPEDQGRAL